MLTWINSYDPLPGEFLFLDRDGVINADSPDYIKSWKEYHFYPDALKALAWLKSRRINAIVISNQSALNRGYIQHEDFWDMHTRMVAAIEERGGAILAAFYCPHRPDEGCSCRKPSPGMILAAREIFRVPSQGCFFIGDRASDMETAERGGCRGVLLDRSPLKTETMDAPAPTLDKRTLRRSTLMEAVEAIYSSSPPGLRHTQ